MCVAQEPSDAGYELVVHAEPGSQTAVRQWLIPPRHGSSLSLDTVELAAGAELTFGLEQADHELVYVLSGELELSSAMERRSVTTDFALLADAAVPATLLARSTARLAVFVAAAGCDEHAQLGARVPCAALDLGSAESATGERSFQGLLGPENGCCRATMFVGVVPPGAASWHFHNYDEIVYLLDGEAAYHQAEGLQSVRPGGAVRIPPRTVHVNENVTSAEMRVLGVFTPAGSPSAAFLANDPRAR